MSAPAEVQRSSSPFEAARRAPWATAFMAAIAVGAAVFLITLVNPATPWRADAREAWSIALLVLFICGGMASLTPPAGAAARSPSRAWALARPWLFALGLAAGCGLAVGFSDLNLWHTTAGTAFAHAVLQAALVALVGPVQALTHQPAG